ncbi:MAG: vWA domain-containing protein, partial [Verrucomicrobiota bacterium]
ENPIAGEQMFYRVVMRVGFQSTLKATNSFTSGVPADTRLVLGKNPRPIGEDAVLPGPPTEGSVSPAPGEGGGGIDGDGFFGGVLAPGVVDSSDGLVREGGDDWIIFPGPGPDPDPGIQPGANLLTAGEWVDHSAWNEFQEFVSAYPDSFTEWQLDFQRRIIIECLDTDGNPLHDVKITTADDCILPQSLDLEAGFELGTTHNDGRIALFPTDGLISPPRELDDETPNCFDEGLLHLVVTVDEEQYETELPLTEDNDQTWTLAVPLKKDSQARFLDLAFVVDVTGSMGDELQFLREELLDIVDQINEEEEAIDTLRVGLVFYRDRGDRIITQVHDFTEDIPAAQEIIAGIRATGGGDFPESVNEALFRAMRDLSWRPENTVRLSFLLADAPPNYYEDEQYIYRDALLDAQQKGIKLIPVAGSGIDKTTEYLFRHLAVSTMGKYIFITDDSGIGGSHIDPDIEQPTVETLNTIMVRTILEEYRKGL